MYYIELGSTTSTHSSSATWGLLLGAFQFVVEEGKKVKVVQFDETAFRNDDEQSISLKVKKLKRVREMSAQTDKSLRDSHAQTDLDFSRRERPRGYSSCRCIRDTVCVCVSLT